MWHELGLDHFYKTIYQPAGATLGLACLGGLDRGAAWRNDTVKAHGHFEGIFLLLCALLDGIFDTSLIPSGF
ncbi:MAG: hypothetical protein HPY76_11920 [Anaerolineae bacterium]|nr:hypothetical protein [Anaerolineae bacterium]